MEQIDNKSLIRFFLKTIIVLEIVQLFLNTPIAIAQDSTVTAYIKPSQMTQAWESARDGALIGFGTGAAVSLIGFSLQAENMDYTRMIAGSTGTGFLIGAVYGLVEDRFFRSSSKSEEHTSRIRPQIFHSRDDKVGYGMFASLSF